MNRREIWVLFRASFMIAVLIFFIAIASEFSIRMYYSSAEWWVQVLAGLLAVLLITLMVLLLLTMASDLRTAIFRMFGIETPE